jgi:hypothetical protein
MQAINILTLFQARQVAEILLQRPRRATPEYFAWASHLLSAQDTRSAA